MEFDLENEVVKLCSKGMEHEGLGENIQASELFLKAWSISKSDFEKFTSAHYVARHQDSVLEKLKWDLIALEFALKIDDSASKTVLPSLYLNVGKCYEDLKDVANARINYELAQSYSRYLPEDGYGKMIKNGIDSGLKRIN